MLFSNYGERVKFLVIYFIVIDYVKLVDVLVKEGGLSVYYLVFELNDLLDLVGNLWVI